MASRRRRYDLSFSIAVLVVMAMVSTFLIALPTLDGQEGDLLNFIVKFALPDLPLVVGARHPHAHELNTAAGAESNDTAKTQELRVMLNTAKPNETSVTFVSDTFATTANVPACKGRLFVVHWTHVPKVGSCYNCSV